MRKVEGYGPDWRREPFHNPRNSADSERRNSRQRQRPGQPKPRKNERTGRARGSSQFPLWKQEPMANGALIPLSSNHVASPCGIPNGVSDVVRPLLLIRTYRSCLLTADVPTGAGIVLYGHKPPICGRCNLTCRSTSQRLLPPAVESIVSEVSCSDSFGSV